MVGRKSTVVIRIGDGNQNLNQLNRIGLHDHPDARAEIAAQIRAAARRSDNVVDEFTNRYGTFVAKESLLVGPDGVISVHTTWEITESGLRLTTVIPFGRGTGYRHTDPPARAAVVVGRGESSERSGVTRLRPSRRPQGWTQ